MLQEGFKVHPGLKLQSVSGPAQLKLSLYRCTCVAHGCQVKVSRQVSVTLGLHAQEAQVVNPHQGAQEGVAGSHDERQQVAQARVALEEYLDAPLLDDTSNELNHPQENPSILYWLCSMVCKLWRIAHNNTCRKEYCRVQISRMHAGMQMRLAMICPQELYACLHE